MKAKGIVCRRHETKYHKTVFLWIWYISFCYLISFRGFFLWGCTEQNQEKTLCPWRITCVTKLARNKSRMPWGHIGKKRWRNIDKFSFLFGLVCLSPKAYYYWWSWWCSRLKRLSVSSAFQYLMIIRKIVIVKKVLVFSSLLGLHRPLII